MNWIILLLLFGRGFGGNCGCDNDCGCGNNRMRSNDCGCGNGNNRGRGNECGENGRNGCRECANAREAVREAKEDVREALRDVREAKEREQAVCDRSGMVPQPWQDYPPMPRRDNGGEADCGCNN